MAQEFSGHIYIFHTLDVGDEIDLDYVKKKQLVDTLPSRPLKYLKHYHTPLITELPHPHATSHCEEVKMYPFGAFTIRYKIPFSATLKELRRKINTIDNEYREQSFEEASIIFKNIKQAILQPYFFHISKSYLVIQIDPLDNLSGHDMTEKFSGDIAGLLRFETENLSEYKKEEIFKNAFGYYRGDLIVVDSEASFVYDKEYEEVIELFEFGNVQQLQLQFFDTLLDKKLSESYYRESHRMPMTSYLPMWSSVNLERISELGKLKVEISVITERLENSIRIGGEPYYAELYDTVRKKLDINRWTDSIEKKLDIIQDVSEIRENKIRVIREDMFNVLISALIFLEFIVAIMHYMRS